MNDDSARCTFAGFHTVEASLFKTKTALVDGINCGVHVQCTHCGFKASEITPLTYATFGLPPAWYARITRNLVGVLIVIQDSIKTEVTGSRS